MLKKDENFHSTCQSCNKLIPNQHFDCHREMVEGYKKTIECLDQEVMRLRQAQAVVDEQAEDEALWYDATYAPEAYLQKELRRLHAIIEGKY